MTVNDDPWAVLGLAPGASVEEARAARRRLAKRLHPDLHGGASAAQMTLVNQALDAIEGAPSAPAVPAEAPDAVGGREVDEADIFPDCFSVEGLAAEAFEALFLAAYGLGDILVVDEPYVLELYLPEPGPCFCRLTLVPEAGGSIVSVDVSPADGGDAPAAGTVIEVLVAELNTLVPG